MVSRMSLFAAGLGLLLGLRHALDPDHVAAVATLLPSSPRGTRLRRGLALGAWWGVGHAATLVLSVTALSLLRLELAGPTPAALELAVSGMLIALGARALWQAWQQGNRGQPTEHHHGDRTHVHATAAPHWHLPSGTALAWRPFLIGSMHGLAGSGGMMLLLAGRQGSTLEIAGFTGAFLAGSILSMAMVTAAGALALGAVGSTWRRGLTAAAGLASIGIGVAWGAAQLQALA